jgi:hypothetical protein
MNVKLKMNINTKNFTAMKKKLFFTAFALALFAGCSDNDYVGDQASLNAVTGNGAISFGFDVPTPTRAAGAAAATKLNNQFIVYAEKNESGKDAPTAGNLVINNYVVNYVTNSAYTSTSNTKDWEYVGFKFDDGTAAIPTTSYSTNITPHSGTGDQTIKYWDYAASNYVFTAVSAKPADISDGKVKITKVTAGTTDEYEKGYEVTVTDGADLASLYFADRVNIAQSNDKDRTAANKYGGNVQFTFRNAVSQVRVGMYETIPGYQVKVTKFYYADAANPAFSGMTSENTTNFVANIPNVSPASGKTSVPGTFTVKYFPKSTENDAAGISNHPTVSFVADPATGKKNYLSLGTGVYNTALATTSATPTFDQTAGAFTTVFPQETNAANLKLKIDYQLSNTVTGETINITGKTAEVPAQYLQWKPNFKYTYLFKITDDELYPITFDAVTIEAEDGTVEYITTVTEPSITTFGVKGGKYVAGKNEYEAGSDIYATFMNGSSVQKPSLTETTKANYVQIYSVTTSDATNFPITEVSVAERLATTPSGTAKLTCTNITTNATDTYFNSVAPAVVETVPSEDGKTKTIDALKLTGVKAGTYAVEIVTYTGSVLAAETSLDGYYSVSGDTYSAASGTADGSSTYYKQVKTYKVIKVVSGS